MIIKILLNNFCEKKKVNQKKGGIPLYSLYHIAFDEYVI